MITFGWERAFSFEIYVVNQWRNSLERSKRRDRIVAARFHDQMPAPSFGQSLLQTGDEKLGLEVDGIDEELAQLFHFRRIDRLLKFDSGVPGAESVVPSQKKWR